MKTSQDIAKLLERFDEPLGDRRRPAPALTKLPVAASGQRFAVPQADQNGPAEPPRPVRPVATKRSGLPRNAVISAVALVALIPLAILILQLWPDMMRPGSGPDSAAPSSVASAPAQNAPALEVALTSPEKIDANGGDIVAFPIIIDATAALPARSIVAITALPDGATFSQGRPYGDNGWSLRLDEIAGLRLQLPAASAAAPMHLQLVAGDGTVLAQSSTELNIGSLPPVVATVDDPGLSSADFAASNQIVQAAAAESVPATEIPSTAAEELAQAQSAASEPITSAETTGSIADVPPAPEAKPDVTVNTVKTVTIAPPRETEPHDGAMALGSPADEPQGTDEWMVTKTAVDMHAKAEQKSDTVKVAQGGVKMRVVSRDNRWIQVHDPATSTTGWIYDRFLTPTEPPAQ